MQALKMTAQETSLTQETPMTKNSLYSNLASYLTVWGKRLLIVPPILLAIGALIYLTQTRPPPKVKTESESARALSVILAPVFEIEPRVIGFGTAEYARKWRPVAQVAGRIQEVHPELRPGAIISAGDIRNFGHDSFPPYISFIRRSTSSSLTSSMCVPKHQS